MKKYLEFLVVIAFALAMVGCGNKVMTFGRKDFTINLPNNFKEAENKSTTLYYKSDEAIVTALKENFTDLESVNINKDSSEEDYANAVIKNNNVNSKVIKKDNLTYFVYQKKTSNGNAYFVAFVKKSKDAFWLVNMGCETIKSEQYKNNFTKWAKTIKVN